MGTLRAAVGAAVVTALLLASPAPAASAGVAMGEGSLSVVQPSIPTDWRERMLLRVNAVRAIAGVPPLRMCPALARSAESYAREMRRADTVSHIGTNGSTALQRVAQAGYRPAYVGENLAAGQLSVAAVMGAWRGSSTHLATMTDPRFRHVGFGYERGRGGQYGTFWAQHFGAGRSCT